MFASAAIFEIAEENRLEFCAATRRTADAASILSEKDFLVWLFDELHRQRVEQRGQEDVEIRTGIFE